MTAKQTLSCIDTVTGGMVVSSLASLEPTRLKYSFFNYGITTSNLLVIQTLLDLTIINPAEISSQTGALTLAKRLFLSYKTDFALSICGDQVTENPINIYFCLLNQVKSYQFKAVFTSSAWLDFRVACCKKVLEEVAKLLVKLNLSSN